MHRLVDILQFCWWNTIHHFFSRVHTNNVNTKVVHHYRKPDVCRVPKALPSAQYHWTVTCAECLQKSTRQTDNTRRKKTLPSASHVALGKATLCRVPKSRHSANAPLPSAAWAALGNKCHVRHTSPHTPVTTGPPLFFAECLTVCTRQRQSRAPHTTVTPLPPCCHERYTVRRPLPLWFAECQVGDTRQNFLCRVPAVRHSAKLCECRVQ